MQYNLLNAVYMYVNYSISFPPLVPQKFVGCMDGQTVFYQKQEKYVLIF